MEFMITVQIGGEDVVAGKLHTYVRHNVESSTFSYDKDYLTRSDAFALEPGLPLVEGRVSSQGAPLFSAFEDCMPDRWGRGLLLREERRRAKEESRTMRSLFESDYLAGVSDVSRQGAIRVWREGVALAPLDEGVPREIELPRLLALADRAAEDVDADVRDLIAAGSSLGGARPKASVRDGMGRLCIAKFPKPSDTDDVSAWEYVALQIARLAGICVPDFRLVRFGGRSILLLDRFDRSQAGRVPYISGLTAVQGRDGGSYSYLELVEFIEEHGSSPMHDLHELWKQMLLTCALGNTDNHLRNYGFLHDGKGWRLSPAFDVNPTQGDFDKSLSTAIDFDVRDADPRAAFDVREYFRLSAEEARHIASQTANVVARWKGLARKAGIDSRSVKEMSSCFECGERRLREIVR